MPIRTMHRIMGACCFWDYNKVPPERAYAFYRSLPFGSSLAPAGWSDVTFALCFIMALAFLAILTHCVDGMCCIEVEETVHSYWTKMISVRVISSSRYVNCSF